MKKILYIIIGIIIGSICSQLFMVSADSIKQNIEVILNDINVNVDGNTLAERNEEYELKDGSKVPLSILYKGTTYLPMRVVAESIGKEVTWNNDTRTADINNNEGDNMNTLSFNIETNFDILNTTNDVEYENFKKLWSIHFKDVITKDSEEINYIKIYAIYTGDKNREEFPYWWTSNKKFEDYMKLMHKEICEKYNIECRFLLGFCYAENEANFGYTSDLKSYVTDWDNWINYYKQNK